jgi:hypothetical protein
MMRESRPRLGGRERHGHARYRLERLGVARHERRVLGVEPHKPPRGESGARLVEAVVEAQLDDVVARRVPAVAVPREARHPVRAEEPHPRRERVGGHDRAALADREVLVREDAEAAGAAERADMAATEKRARRVGRVLEQHEPVALRERPQRLDAARVTSVGHRHDPACAVGHRRLGAIGGQPGRGERLDVGEDRRSARVADGVDAGDDVSVGTITSSRVRSPRRRTSDGGRRCSWDRERVAGAGVRRELLRLRAMLSQPDG